MTMNPFDFVDIDKRFFKATWVARYSLQGNEVICKCASEREAVEWLCQEATNKGITLTKVDLAEMRAKYVSQALAYTQTELDKLESVQNQAMASLSTNIQQIVKDCAQRQQQILRLTALQDERKCTLKLLALSVEDERNEK